MAEQTYGPNMPERLWAPDWWGTDIGDDTRCWVWADGAYREFFALRDMNLGNGYQEMRPGWYEFYGVNGIDYQLEADNTFIYLQRAEHQDEDGLLDEAESVEPAPPPADEGGKRGRDYTTTPLNPADVREVIAPTPPPALPAGINPAEIPAQAFPYTIYSYTLHYGVTSTGSAALCQQKKRAESRKVKRALRRGVLAPHMALNAFAHEGV